MTTLYADDSGQGWVNARWVATAPDRWALRSLDGTRLGSLVWFRATNWDPPRWAPLPRGRNYLPSHSRIRAAALDLEFHLGVRSSDACAENRHRAALLP